MLSMRLFLLLSEAQFTGYTTLIDNIKKSGSAFKKITIRPVQ